VDLPVLHNEHEIFVGLGEHRNVLQQIAVVQKNVGERTFLNAPQLARVRISRSAHSQQLSIPGSRLPKNLEVAEPLRAVSEFLIMGLLALIPD